MNWAGKPANFKPWRDNDDDELRSVCQGYLYIIY